MCITSKMMNVFLYSVFVLGFIYTGIDGSTAETSEQAQTSLKTDEGQTITAMGTSSLLQTNDISAATSTPTLDASLTLQLEGDTMSDMSPFSSMSSFVELNRTAANDVASSGLEPIIETANIHPSIYETNTTTFITEDSNNTILVPPEGDSSDISPSFSSVPETDVATMFDTLSSDLDVSETTDFEMEPSTDIVVFSENFLVSDASSSLEQSMSSQIMTSQNDSSDVFSNEISQTETFSLLSDTADFMSSLSEFVESVASLSDSSEQYLDSLSSSLEDTSIQTTEVQVSPSLEPTPSSVPPSSTSTSVPIQPSPTSVIQPTSTPVLTSSSPDLTSAMYSSSITESENVTTSIKPPISDTSRGSGGLSSGGKAAIGIVVSLCIVGLIIVGVYFYRKHHMTPGSFKQLLTNGVRYRTYNNPGYKDDEVEMDGTAMERFH